jgi:hypothetical protein
MCEKEIMIRAENKAKFSIPDSFKNLIRKKNDRYPSS